MDPDPPELDPDPPELDPDPPELDPDPPELDPDPEPDPDPLIRGTDPGIQIRIQNVTDPQHCLTVDGNTR